MSAATRGDPPGRPERRRWRPGPGLVVAAAFLGPGTITTATVAGADTGYALLWVVPLAIAVAFIVQELVARASLVTGRPPAQLLEAADDASPAVAKGGRVAAITAVAVVAVGAAVFQAGNLAGASLGAEAALGGARAWWIVAVADLAFLLLWFGRYQVLERVLIGLVAVMGLAFLVDAALVGVDWSGAAGGLVPTVDDLSIGLVLALLGTTVVPYNLFLHPEALKARGLAGPGSLRAMRGDLFVSLVIGGAVTAAVLVTSAGLLHGTDVESAADMAGALEPLAGPVAETAFGVGLFAAGLSSAITAPLAAALAAAQLSRGRARKAHERADPRVWVPVLATGTVVALLPASPVSLIVAAQIANALLLPVLVGGFLWVANRAGLLGRHRNRLVANIAGAAALGATVFLVLRLVL